MSEYQPGYCNIGPRQRRRRLAVSAAGFLAAAASIGAVLGGFLPRPLLPGVFVPLAVGFEWGLQAYTAFCVRLALANRYDFRGGDGGTGDVADPANRRADRAAAARVTALGIGLAGVVTVVVVLAVGSLA